MSDDVLLITQLPADKSKLRLQVDKVLDWKLATQIQRMIVEAQQVELSTVLDDRLRSIDDRLGRIEQLLTKEG